MSRRLEPKIIALGLAALGCARAESPSSTEVELGVAELLVPGGESDCELRVGGELVGLDDADGWTVPAPEVIELLGAACDAFTSGATPELSCSCDALDG